MVGGIYLMMKLSDREWKTFPVEDIFKVDLSNGDNKANKLPKGRVPLISSGTKNNGVVKFVLCGDGKSQLFQSGTLTFDMFGKCFYHPYQFYAVSHGRINVLSNKKMISKYVSIFLLAVIEKSSENIFSYNRMASSKRMKKLKLKLPVDYNNHPDYDFMEQYIKEKYFYIKSQIKEKQKHEINDWRELSEIEWSIFEMDNIFKFKQGKSKGLNHLKIGGRVPYLGAKYNNNGVLAFVQNNSNFITKGNCISFIRNGEGSMGYSIYKHEDHIATSDITNGYNNHLNKYNGQFISTMSNLVRGKYNFGYKRSLTRLKKEQIKLPSINNQPDYDFMEQYMKRKENEVLEKI